MIGFRDRGIFYEAVTNQILDDLVASCHPRRMTVVGDFTVRGGIKTTVTATYAVGSAYDTRYQSRNRRAQVSLRGVPELDDERMTLERLLDEPTLNAFASPVNQTHLA